MGRALEALKGHTYRQRKIGKRRPGESESAGWRRIHGSKTASEIEDERELARRKRKMANISAQRDIDRMAGF